jgi:DNA-binding Lrp family transcriptional regulator
VSATGIPDEVKALVLEHIDSIEQLEVLLLLFRQPHHDYDSDEVCRELRISSQSCIERLRDLHARGLIERNEAGYRFGADPERNRRVFALSQSYLERRVAMINLIFSKPTEKIRSFANAFRLRKDEE